VVNSTAKGDQRDNLAGLNMTNVTMRVRCPRCKGSTGMRDSSTAGTLRTLGQYAALVIVPATAALKYLGSQSSSTSGRVCGQHLAPEVG